MQKNIGPFIGLITLFFISCGDIFERYDPMEKSRYVFDLDNMVFLMGNNYIPPANTESYFSMDDYGHIDRKKGNVDFIVPPSLDETAILTADINLRNIGSDNYYSYYYIQESRNWYTNPKLKLDQSLIGYPDEYDQYFELEYRINFKKKLIFESHIYPDYPISTYPYNIFYDVPTPVVFIQFNDKVQASSLTIGDFDTDYTITNIFYSADPASYFQIFPATLTEGIYHISLAPNTCEASTSGYFNESSFSFIFALDENPPVTDSSFSTAGSDFSPAQVDDFLLKLNFNRASDSITPDKDLLYKICYSTTGPTDVDGSSIGNMFSTMDYIPVNGYEWFSYQDTLTFFYGDLPFNFQSDLTTLTDFYINILVMDKSFNSNHCAVYNLVQNQYLGP